MNKVIKKGIWWVEVNKDGKETGRASRRRFKPAPEPEVVKEVKKKAAPKKKAASKKDEGEQ